MASPPPLVYRRTNVPQETYFVTIDLGRAAQSKPLTGIFLPDNYRVSSQADMILWLMGHHKTTEYPTDLDIEEYWTRYMHFRFREFVNTSQKNVVLVAPTLGPSSESGKLTDRDGLSWYLDQVLAALQAYGPYTDVPPLGELVIACHSGGGSPMLKIATSNSQYTSNIKQLWGFDSLYGGEDAWLKWAQANSSKMLFIRFGDGGTAGHCQTLENMSANQSNIDIDGTTATAHNRVPVTYFHNFMRKARFFLDR